MNTGIDTRLMSNIVVQCISTKENIHRETSEVHLEWDEPLPRGQLDQRQCHTPTFPNYLRNRPQDIRHSSATP